MKPSSRYGSQPADAGSKVAGLSETAGEPADFPVFDIIEKLTLMTPQV
jgi:hypothetical protein